MRKFFLAVVCLASFSASAAIKIQRIKNGSDITITNMLRVDGSATLEGQIIRHIPKYLPEMAPPSKEIYEEVLVPENEVSQALLSKFEQKMQRPFVAGSEVRALAVQGPPSNRINLTIVGDGYTTAEKDKFFEDAVFIKDGLFADHAFSNYLPLFNVYAVFVPSQESGIGDGSPKNTALRLYRDPKGSKRGIMPGDAQAARRAVALAPATDFPILIANDDFYGGLGGEFAISTRSRRSGLIVLRHELGHNFGEVGEEYDGGYVYSGANASSSADAPWKYWSPTGTLKVNKALMLSGEYVWKNLSGGNFDVGFKFPNLAAEGPFNLNLLISSVGWATDQDVEFKIDGTAIQLPGPFHNDRNFYDITINSLNPGNHKIHVEEKIKDKDNVIAFVQSFALAADYDRTPDAIGSYMTYDDNGKLSYRPTHNSCVMRNMTINYFCAVDRENMWRRFLARTSLIDNVVVTTQASGVKHVELQAVPLAGLEIHWFKIVNGQAVEDMALVNKMDWDASSGDTGSYKVTVKFQTPEVRAYTNRFTAEKSFAL